MAREDETINELEAVYQEKCFRHLDENIPLHSLTHAVARFTLSRMRFKVHNPRARAAVSGGDVYMTREESDLCFESALTALEMVDVSIRGKLSSHLFTHMSFNFQLDVYIYVISDLRRRRSGDRVALAWRLVEDLYNEHPELIDDAAANTFFFALGDLTLEAWEMRRKELARGHQGVLDTKFVTPQFVWSLRHQRENMLGEDRLQMSATVPDPQGLMWTDGNDLDWEYWNDFLLV